jgi:hypothetical protein
VCVCVCMKGMYVGEGVRRVSFSVSRHLSETKLCVPNLRHLHKRLGERRLV